MAERELVQVDKEKEVTPWKDGNYICEGMAKLSLFIDGQNVTIRRALVKADGEMTKGSWKYGNFGEADTGVAEATGKTFNNWEMEVWGGKIKRRGVVSDDGKKITFINITKDLDHFQWVSEEEFAAFKDSGDPADAPPSHYKLQPENLGKFLFISGGSGLGKSTTGLLLSRMAGYVYYEGDCFMQGTNPYLLPDAKDPSLDALKQKPLKGMPQERIDAIAGGFEDFMALIEGKQFNMENIESLYSTMSKDLAKERKRLGGDWAVAQAVPLRSLRDLIRAELGPDLLFIVLNMKKEDQKMRILARNGESIDTESEEAMNAFLDKMCDVYEPAEEDEPNAIGIEVTADMSRQDVVQTILRMIHQNYGS